MGDETESQLEKVFNMSYNLQRANEMLETIESSRTDDSMNGWNWLEVEKSVADENVDNVDHMLVQNEGLQPLEDPHTEQLNINIALTDNMYVEEDHNEYITDSDIEKLEESSKKVKFS